MDCTFLHGAQKPEEIIRVEGLTKNNSGGRGGVGGRNGGQGKWTRGKSSGPLAWADRTEISPRLS